MTNRHTITHADELYAGAAYKAAASPDGRRGVKMTPLRVAKLGAVATADPDGVCVDAANAGAGALTLNGALVAAGVVIFDVARNVSITSTSNNSGITFTFTGIDDNDVALVETMTGPNNTTVYGEKAFKTITGGSVSGAITGNVDIGSGTSYGLPVRIADKGDVLGVYVDGVPETTLTVVPGLALGTAATATNADVRGLVTPGTAANGTRVFAVLLAPNITTGDKAFGVDQFGG